MFWSSQTLQQKLRNRLIDPYDDKRVVCASYELRVGEHAYVTRDNLEKDTGELTQLLEALPPRDTVVIPPGQFAFILTEETIKVPKDAIAFISMKASLKFRGLINVSGFHVDPGFSGKLIFSMYNAGPRDIILTRYQQAFIIVYGDLDQPSARWYNKPGPTKLKAELIDHISSGQVFSPMRLQREMNEIRTDLTEVRIRSRLIDGVVVATLGLLLTIIVGGAAALFASDTALATVGGWIANAVNVYETRVLRDAEQINKRNVTEKFDKNTLTASQVGG